jgi:hypothetical protein
MSGGAASGLGGVAILGLAPVPGQQPMQPGGRVVGNPGQDIGEPGTWVDTVQLGGGDERIHGSRLLAATIAAGNQPGLTTESHLGVEDGVDPPHCPGRQWHAGDLDQLEELASAMRPAGGRDDWAGLPPGRVEVVEPGIGVRLQTTICCPWHPLAAMLGTVGEIESRRR